MPDDSPNLGLPYLAAAQAQKHVTMNEALRRLDALVQPTIETRSLLAEPSAPTDGTAYILPIGKSGTAWAAPAANSLALWQDGLWTFLTPKIGWQVFARDEKSILAFDGTAWITLAKLNGLRGRADRLVAFVGTSLVQNGNESSSTKTTTASARGWQNWAHVLSHGRFDAPLWWDDADFPNTTNKRWFRGLNEGVSGQSSTDIIARLDRVIALKPVLVVLDIGTNDVGGGATFEALRDNTIAAVKRLTNEGIEVLLLPILARATSVGGAWAAGAAGRKLAARVNAWRQDWARTQHGVSTLDWNLAWQDPNSTEGEPLANYSSDGTHFSVQGAFAVGKALARWFETAFPAASPRLVSRGDVFDATNNPLGNLIPNPLFARTTGGSFGTATIAHPSPPGGATAGLADSWRVERSTGSAVTARTYVAPKLDDWGFARGNNQAIEFVPSGTATERFFLRPAPADITHSFAAGVWVQAFADIEVSAWDGWRSLRLRLEHRSATSFLQAVIGLDEFEPTSGTGVFDPLPGEAWKGRIVTPLMRLDAGGTVFRPRVEIAVQGTGAGTPTLQIAAFGLRQVEDPRPALGIPT